MFKLAQASRYSQSGAFQALVKFSVATSQHKIHLLQRVSTLQKCEHDAEQHACDISMSRHAS